MLNGSDICWADGIDENLNIFMCYLHVVMRAALCVCGYSIVGCARVGLSLRATQNIAAFQFVNVAAERVIEADHKDVKLAVGYNKASPMSVSVAVRTTTIL